MPVPVFQETDPLVPHYLGYLPSSTTSILAVLRTLSAPGAAPALIHCTAGKDRTGAAFILPLDALGIDPASD